MDLQIQKQILKGQCINIAMSNITNKSEIKARIELAKEIYYDILKSNYYEW